MNTIGTSQEKSEHIGDRIVMVRGKISQGRFGEALNLTRRQVSTMERGEVLIPSDVCVAIHRKFGVSLTWLLLGEGQPTYALGDKLTEEEREFIDLARRAPETLPLIKKAITDSYAVRDAINELISSVFVIGQRQIGAGTTRRLPSSVEHDAVAA